MNTTYYRDQAKKLGHKTGENPDMVMWRDGLGWYITGRELDEKIREEIAAEQACVSDEKNTKK